VRVRVEGFNAPADAGVFYWEDTDSQAAM
jgi:hypothetical protein